MDRMRPFFSPDRLALTGTLIGLASLFPGWLTLRPNRLAAGTNINIWESLGTPEAVAIAALWSLCLFLSLVGWRRWGGVFLGAATNAILVVVFFGVGLGSSRLLAGETAI